MQRSGNSWVGWVIFVFLIFGSRLLPPVAAWLSQVTGLQITPPMLVVAAIALSVAGSLLGSAVRGAARARGSNETRLPTPPPMDPPPGSTGAPRPVSPPRPRPGASGTGLPPTMSTTRLPPPRLPPGEQRLPGPPQFEPIIDPRVLTFGIVGLLFFGGFFLFVLFLMGSTP